MLGRLYPLPRRAMMTSSPLNSHAVAWPQLPIYKLDKVTVGEKRDKQITAERWATDPDSKGGEAHRV
jgi:hypothetical protein